VRDNIWFAVLWIVCCANFTNDDPPSWSYNKNWSSLRQAILFLKGYIRYEEVNKLFTCGVFDF
jgi:hypothetical protein